MAHGGATNRSETQTRRGIANAALIMNILARCVKNQAESSRAWLAITTDAGDDDGTGTGTGGRHDDDDVGAAAADGADRIRRE